MNPRSPADLKVFIHRVTDQVLRDKVKAFPDKIVSAETVGSELLLFYLQPGAQHDRRI